MMRRPGYRQLERVLRLQRLVQQTRPRPVDVTQAAVILRVCERTIMRDLAALRRAEQAMREA